MLRAGAIMKYSFWQSARRRMRNLSAKSARLHLAPYTWMIAGGLVLMIAIAVGTALTVENFRQDAIKNGREALESAVLLLARHFDQQFADFSVLQRSIVAELESHGFESPEIFRSEMGTLAVHEVLRSKANGWADVAGANVFDANGVLINSSQRWPVADARISDRAYFLKLKNNPALVEEVEVVPSRLSHGKAIVFARTISGPHGEFLGVVSRAITPDLLEAFFASAGLGPQAAISMHHRNGQLLARYPTVETLIGKNFRNGPPEQQSVFERPSFATRLASPVDGRERLIASRMLTTEPLIVVATNTVDATLASWRSQTKFFIIIAVVSVVLIITTLYLIFRQMTQHLSIEKQRLDTAINNMTQGLLLFDSTERLIVCNRRYIDMYGLSQAVVKPGCSFRDVIRHRHETGSFTGDVEDYCNEVLNSVGRSQSSVVETSDGRLIEISNEPVASGGWLATHEDVTERVRSEDRIAHLAHYDALTDLPNRVLMRGHLERRFAELSRDKPFAILYIDIDEFKGVNDSLGHEVGDELLRQIATRLRDCIGPQDLVARLGGDEFAVVTPEARERGELKTLAEHILRSLRVPACCKGQEIAIEASIGIAVAPDDGLSLDDLLKNADLAMYAAKSDGRRTYRFFVPELETRLKSRRQMEVDLRQAVTLGQFEIHYQPLVQLTTDRVAGCEALLRWHHPQRGLISPAEFIPVAEDTGLINEIGEWILERACAEAAHWPEHIRLAVNVSPVQFRSKTLALRIATALNESGLAPNRLEIEITETVLIGDAEEALMTLHQIRDLGVRIALDDFGTGYSSLSYLRRFPFDKIKIDRCFISDIENSEGSSMIVQAVVNIAAACHMTATAEGVETEKQREILRRLGCNEMQGYLFSPAITSSELEQLLLSHASAAA
jgi:diguanylate cyclase (GGDEF)-like protein